MQITYKECGTVEIHAMRFYEVEKDKTYFPSITTVLGNSQTEEKKQSLQNWRNSLGHSKADAITAEAARRGTSVHLLAERYLKGEPLEQENDEKKFNIQHKDRTMFNGLKLKLKNITEVWGQEVPLWSNDLEVAGRCDLICKYKDVPAIVDYKTSRRIKNKNEITDYALQLTFYAIAHNEMYGTDINLGVILMVSDEGFPLEFTFNLDKYYVDLATRVDTFYDSLAKKLIK